MLRLGKGEGGKGRKGDFIRCNLCLADILIILADVPVETRGS